MNVAEVFGATEIVSVQKFTIYLPDKDRLHKPIPDFELWTEFATILLAAISDGATLLPPAVGIWNDDGGRQMDQTSLVYSYIEDPVRFEREIARIVSFVHSFGQRTNQAMVFIERSGEFLVKGAGGKDEIRYSSRSYRIIDYTKAVDSSIPLDDLLDHLLQGLD